MGGKIDNVGGATTGITGRNVGLNFGGTRFRLYFSATGRLRSLRIADRFGGDRASTTPANLLNWRAEVWR